MPVPQPGEDDFKHVSDQDRNVTGLAHLEMSHWDFGRRSRFAEVSGANRSEPERNGAERSGPGPPPEICVGWCHCPRRHGWLAAGLYGGLMATGG